MHILGGIFGLTAALFIGPRSNKVARYLQANLRRVEQKDNIHLAVIGAFFLWFGWLGFNSGNAETWYRFQLGFLNTIIGAGVGGLVGLIIAITSIRVLAITISSDLWTGSAVQELLRETGNLDRVVIGMMGGLVAVTANAIYVRPWQAFLEAMIGATVAIVGSAVMARYNARVDDPLGAIATHAFAGTIGVLLTAWFYQPARFTVQVLGCLAAAVIGGTFASVICGFLRIVESLRGSRESRFYRNVLRLTPYEERTGKIRTEFWEPAEDDIERAIGRLRDGGPPQSVPGGDRSWIAAVQVLALSDKSNMELEKLFEVLDWVLDRYDNGGAEEQTAVDMIRARGDFTRLRKLVSLALKKRGPEAGWNALNLQYRKTLVLTIAELAESFAADLPVLRIEGHPNLTEMNEGFEKARQFLREISLEDKSVERTLRRIEELNAA